MKNKYNQFGMKIFPVGTLTKLDMYFESVGFEKGDIVDISKTEDGWTFQHKNGMVGQLTDKEIEEEYQDYLEALDPDERQRLKEKYGG